ncbi:MAG: DUF2177 family protein [Granulosicoccus sp.]
MKAYLIAYSSAVIAFLIIDGLWLAVIAKSFYSSQLGDLLRKNFLILPASVFYLAYTAGLVFLAVRPTQTELPLTNVALYGAIVGFMAYGTYDMTNLATLRNWSAAVSLVDTLWGTFLSASVATISAICVRHFSG